MWKRIVNIWLSLFNFEGILAEKFLFFHINKPELPLFLYKGFIEIEMA